MKCTFTLVIAGWLLLAANGCQKGEGDEVAGAAPAASAGEAGPVTNRIDVPQAVRDNLAITFAKVERRQVAATIRVPGRFELLPSARREYRATVPGWVQPLVEQYHAVKEGEAVFEMDSPEWHRMRKGLHEGQAAITKAEAERKVARRTLAEAEATVAALEERIEALAVAEVRRAELDAELVQRRAAVPRLEAEVEVTQAALNEARHDFALNLASTASLLGQTTEYLTEIVPVDQQADSGGGEGKGEGEAVEGGHDNDDAHAVQRWFAIERVGLSARADGVVESVGVSAGGWAEANALVATVVDPTALRFRAVGLQSDLPRLKDGLSVLIVPALSDGIDRNEAIAGTLTVGLNADPDRRTIDLIVTPDGDEPLPAWARAGVSAFLEIATRESAAGDLAIPQGCVVQDELDFVIFRRDPNDPDKVIRLESDLGVSDGRWVAVRSGVKAGDEIVLSGAYDLNLLGGGKKRGEGGHFHPDGTYHAGPD